MSDIQESPNTEPGYTRLLKAHNLGRTSSASTTCGSRTTQADPTNSFKDRVVACALSAARELDAKVFACPSTGNLANAVAAAGARAGIKTVVFIPSNLEPPEQVNSAVFTEQHSRSTATLRRRQQARFRDRRRGGGLGFVNVNVRPYYAEGSKTLGYEIAEQLGWRLPDQIVIPVASGSQLTKVPEAFRELVELGLVEDKPCKVFGAQATGCSPIGRLQGGHRRDPPGQARHHRQEPGHRQPRRRCLRPRHLPRHRRGGGVHHRRRGPRGDRALARTEGIFTETAGGTTVGVLKKLVETGHLDPSLETVVINTGQVSRRWTRCPTPSARLRRSSRRTPPPWRPDSPDPQEESTLTAHVRIPTILRSYTDGESEVTAAGTTLSEVLDDLDANYAGIKGRILDDNGELRASSTSTSATTTCGSSTTSRRRPRTAPRSR